MKTIRCLARGDSLIVGSIVEDAEHVPLLVRFGPILVDGPVALVMQMARYGSCARRRRSVADQVACVIHGVVRGQSARPKSV